MVEEESAEHFLIPEPVALHDVLRDLFRCLEQRAVGDAYLGETGAQVECGGEHVDRRGLEAEAPEEDGILLGDVQQVDLVQERHGDLVCTASADSRAE